MLLSKLRKEIRLLMSKSSYVFTKNWFWSLKNRNKTAYPQNMSATIIVFRKFKKCFVNWINSKEEKNSWKYGTLWMHQKSGLWGVSLKHVSGINIEDNFWTMTMSCIIEEVERIQNFTADHILSLFLQRRIYLLFLDDNHNKDSFNS